MTLSLKIRNFIGSKILKNSFVLNTIYNRIYVWKNKAIFMKEVDRRKKLSVLDYNELSQELPFCPIEFVKDSNFYGYANCIKKSAGLDVLDCSIEHGLYYDDSYIPSASFSRTIKKIITLSDIRVRLISEKTGKPTLAIGPYIHYANSLLSNDQKKVIKEKYGKILLFFPSHGDVEGKVSYNVKNIVNRILELKEKYSFDTIFVNMYYYDILYNTKFVREYEKAGFYITTAGHRYDLNFISRLRSIIELSDMTVANGFGTNIGFSIYLNKPFVYIGDNNMQNYGIMVPEVLSCFKEDSTEITAQQLKVVAKYWGFDCIKTPDEIRSFIKG